MIRAKHWEGGGTVENPKALLRELITEVETSRAVVTTLRELHVYVLDFCDEYVCSSCGQNPCPTLVAIDDE